MLVKHSAHHYKTARNNSNFLLRIAVACYSLANFSLPFSPISPFSLPTPSTPPHHTHTHTPKQSKAVVLDVIIFCRVKDMAEDRHKKLDESNALHQFYRDLDDEESWIK